MRNIQVFSTQGKSGGTFMSDATTLSGIMANLATLKISVDNMRIITGDEVEILGQDSKLPEGDFELFFMQKKSKAGFGKLKLDRSEIYQAIKKAYEDKTVEAGFFSIDGKNHTMCGSEPLAALLATIGIRVSGYASTTSEAPVAPKEIKREQVAASQDLASTKPNKSLVRANADRAVLGDILLALAGVVVPEALQDQFNAGIDSLTQVSVAWDNPGKAYDKAAMEAKANKLRNRISGLA